jgi:HlyD family secretion protein
MEIKTLLNTRHKTCSYFLLLVMVVLVGCQEAADEETPKQQTFLVKEGNLNDALYYSGNIQPKAVTSIASPIDGIVIEQLFVYGQKVSAGQKIIVVESEELARDFVNSVGEYIKAVDDYADKKRQYLGAEELKRLEFISENNYYSDKNAYQQAYFSKQQARYKLQQFLQKMDITESIDTMDLKNSKLIDQVLEQSHNHLVIKAPREGIALLPSTEGDSGNKTIQEGSEIKKGQVLLTIGDFSGITLRIDVNQTDIQHLTLNQPAEITSSAFPEYTLAGYISHMDQQARADGRATPTFSVTISVPTLTAQQKQAIHIGMNAKVAIKSHTDHVISIPLAAVTRDQNHAWVIRMDENNIPTKQLVTLGKTTLDKIVVKQGLVPGDKIIYAAKPAINTNEPDFSNQIVMMNS